MERLLIEIWLARLTTIVVVCLMTGSMFTVNRATAQEKTAPNAPGTDGETLATVLYSIGKTRRKLVIVKKEITVRPEDQRNFWKTHPQNYLGIPNVVLMLVDSDADEPGNDKIIWISYDFHVKRQYPSPVWNADVVRNPDGREAFVVIVKSSAGRTLTVYRVDLDKSVAPYPLELSSQNYDGWPKPSSPLSEIRKRSEEVLSEDLVSPIVRVKAVLEDKTLSVITERKNIKGRESELRFNLDTKEWSESKEK
jgi:hypothetical protein